MSKAKYPERLRAHFTTRQLKRANKVHRRRRFQQFAAAISDQTGAGTMAGMLAGLAWALVVGLVLVLLWSWTFGPYRNGEVGLIGSDAATVAYLALIPGLGLGALIGWLVSRNHARRQALGTAGWAAAVSTSKGLVTLLMVPTFIAWAWLFGVMLTEWLNDWLVELIGLDSSWVAIYFGRDLAEAMLFVTMLVVLTLPMARVTAKLTARVSGLLAHGGRTAISGAGAPSHWDWIWALGWGLASVLVLTALVWTGVHAASGLYAEQFGLNDLDAFLVISAVICILTVIALCFVAFVSTVALRRVEALAPSGATADPVPTASSRVRARLLVLAVLGGFSVWFHGLFGLDSLPAVAQPLVLQHDGCAGQQTVTLTFGPGWPDVDQFQLELQGPSAQGFANTPAAPLELSLSTISEHQHRLWIDGQRLDLGSHSRPILLTKPDHFAPLIVIPRPNSLPQLGDTLSTELQIELRCVPSLNDTLNTLQPGDRRLARITLQPDPSIHGVWAATLAGHTDRPRPDDTQSYLRLRPFSVQPLIGFAGPLKADRGLFVDLGELPDSAELRQRLRGAIGARGASEIAPEQIPAAQWQSSSFLVYNSNANINVEQNTGNDIRVPVDPTGDWSRHVALVSVEDVSTASADSDRSQRDTLEPLQIVVEVEVEVEVELVSSFYLPSATETAPRLPVGTVGTGSMRSSAKVGFYDQRNKDDHWWRWESAQDGILTLDTDGSPLADTVLVVYQTRYEAAHLIPGETELKIIGKNDDSNGTAYSHLRLPVKGNIPYWIRVNGYSQTTGDVILTWRFSPRSKPLRPDHLP